MTKKNDITLPTPEDERLLNDVLEDSVDYVEVRGKKYGISWLKRGTIRKLMTKEEAEHILHEPATDKRGK